MWRETVFTARAGLSCFPMIEDFDEEPAVATTPESAEEAGDAAPIEASPSPPPPPTLEEIAASRAHAYAQGRADEQAEAEAGRSAAVARDLASLVRSLEREAGAASLVAETAAEHAAKLLLKVLASMMPSLLIRHGPADVRELLDAVIPALVHETSVTIRVCPELRDMIGGEIARLAPEIASRVELTTSAAMTPGDVRILWNGGAASRDVAELWNRIAASLAPLGLLELADCQLTHAGRETAHV